MRHKKIHHCFYSMVIPLTQKTRLQPLDVSFVKPFSTYYDQAATGWLHSNPGKVVTMYQIAEIFGKAFLQVATMQTAINGFRKCGIWPYNSLPFNNSDFIAAETTDRCLTTSLSQETLSTSTIPTTEAILRK